MLILTRRKPQKVSAQKLVSKFNRILTKKRKISQIIDFFNKNETKVRKRRERETILWNFFG